MVERPEEIVVAVESVGTSPVMRFTQDRSSLLHPESGWEGGEMVGGWEGELFWSE